jgi:tRNA threonylcarbamoyladenosine biosynthesis protein TsaE
MGECLAAGDLIALSGELGSGKTWFTKGLALGLGVSPDTVVTSPSFALMNDYEGRLTLSHMDVYRLESVSDFLNTGLDEYFYGDGVVVMEWADRWPEILPDWAIEVNFAVLDEQSREITMSGHHVRAVRILKKIEGKLER